MLRRYNIWAVTSGPLERVTAWRAAEPERIIPAQSFSDASARSPEDFRRLWPEAIRVAIETIESADFLTPEQKRDIFYDNAARFLRLREQQIARHHGRR